MKMTKLLHNEILQAGDVIKLKGNTKASPICLLVGQKISDIISYCGDELEGFYRPIQPKETA